MPSNELFCLQIYLTKTMKKYRCNIGACIKAIDYDLAFLVERAENARYFKLSELLTKIVELSHVYKQMSSNKEKTINAHENRFVAYLQATDVESLVEMAKGIKFMQIDILLSEFVAAKHAHECADVVRDSLDRYKYSLKTLFEHLDLDLSFLINKARNAQLNELISLLEKILELRNAYNRISLLDNVQKKCEYRLVAQLQATNFITIEMTATFLKMDQLFILMKAIKHSSDATECRSELVALKNELLAANLDVKFISEEAKKIDQVEFRSILKVIIELVESYQEVFLWEQTSNRSEDELVHNLRHTNWITLEEEAKIIKFLNVDELLVQVADIKEAHMSEYRKRFAAIFGTMNFDFESLLEEGKEESQHEELTQLLVKLKKLAETYHSTVKDMVLDDELTLNPHENVKLKRCEDDFIVYLQDLNLDLLAAQAREKINVCKVLSKLKDAKKCAYEVKVRDRLASCLKDIDIGIVSKLKESEVKEVKLLRLLEELVDLKNAYKEVNPLYKETLKRYENKLMRYLVSVDIKELEPAAIRTRSMNAVDLVARMKSINHKFEVEDPEENTAKYRSRLAASLRDFDFSLNILISKAKEAKLLQIQELLERIMELCNIHQKVITMKLDDEKYVKEHANSPIQDKNVVKMMELAGITSKTVCELKTYVTVKEDDLIAYLKLANLEDFMIQAREIQSINVDELVSKLLKLKCTFTEYNANILPFAMKSLIYYEEQIAANIEDLSLLRVLAQEAQTAGLLPEKEKNILTSVHCSVPCSLMYRYLIPHVYVAIEKDLNAFDHWLTMLSKCMGISGIFSKMKCLFENLIGDTVETPKENFTVIFFKDTHVSILTEALASFSSYWRELAIALGLPQNEISTILSMMHSYESITTCLYKVLHGWVTKKYSQAKPPTLESLTSALKSKTVGLGKAAIILGEEILNSGIFEPFENRDSKALDSEPFSSAENNTFRIIEQSHSTTATESNSTILFGVRVNAYSETSVEYQWYKDGEILDDSVRDHRKYYGSKESIICVFIYSLAVEGSYSCKIQLGGDIMIFSKPIELTIKTPLDKYREKLIDFYTAKPEVPEDTWPPANIDSYINLALIKQQGIDNAGEYVHGTIRGDADDVLKDKEKIEYESAFEKVSSGTLLLIEGRPGSGKTTLVHKVSKDWAEGKLNFGHLRLLFFVHLRGFLSNPKIKLQDILGCYFDDCNSGFGDIISYASKHNGLGLGFILDGLDEYLPKKKDTFIHRLIKKLQLPKAMVIVASRPVATADFRSTATRQIEVLGFLKEQITEYINAYKFSDNFKCTTLLKYLDLHPNVHHMCYLPIHTAMVCFLGQVGRSLPDSETGIYNDFTICFFLRSMKIDREDVFIESIEALPMPEKETYKKICKLAFETTASSKQVMNEKDVKDYFDASSNKDYLGLINVDKVALKQGHQKLYTFLHLTFQEFLAACYVSYLDKEEQAKVISEYGHSKQMQVVWKFYCGLVKFDSRNNFEALIEKLKYGALYNVQCSFESQQPSTCDTITKKGSLSFKGNFFSPSDFTAIAFVMSNSTQSIVRKLVFDECTLRQEGIDILIEKAGGRLSSVTTLCFHGRNCATEQLKLVNKLMHALPSLKILDITNTQLGEDAVRALTNNLSHPKLQVLKIDTSDRNPLYSSNSILKNLVDSFTSNCTNFYNVWFPDYSKRHLMASSLQSLPFYLGSAGNLSDIDLSFHVLQSIRIQILSDDFQFSSACKRLSLIGCNITDFDVEVLSKSINGSSIEIIELNVNHVGNNGAISLSHFMKSCLCLRTLNLSCNQIGDEGALAIVKAALAKGERFELFLWNNNITKSCAADLVRIAQNVIIFNALTIQGRDVGSNGAATISKCLANFFECQKEDRPLEVLEYELGKLTKLDLSSSSIGDDDITKIADALKISTNITSLDLSNNSLSISGVRAFTDALKGCISMKSLNLACNSLSDDGVVALAESSLIRNKSLTCLNLSGTRLGYFGAKALAGALKNCTHLNSLDLSNNSLGDGGIKELADHALRNCLLLASVDVSSNSISSYGAKELADALRCFSGLTFLNISDNSIGNDGIKSLATALKNHTNLQCLKAERTNIDKICSKSLADIIKHCSKLEGLEIGCNAITESGIKIFSPHLKKCAHLNSLDLRKALLGQNGMKFLAKALKNSTTTLSQLDVSDNAIGGDGTKNISSMLKNCSNLQVLHIGKNNLGKDGSQALCDVLMKGCHLHTLDISHNNIGREGAKSLASAIEHCGNLRTLDICNNKIGPGGTNTVALSLKVCTNLQTLDISHNDIGLIGATALAATLSHCSDLSKLNVSHNCIGKDGMQVLAGAIKLCGNLHSLDFASNNIGPGDGAKALSEAIRCSSKLCTLVISNNDLKDGIGSICLSLTCCSNLHTLDVSYNLIKGNFAGALVDVMKCCSKLCSLNVSHNDLKEDSAKAIADILKYSSNLSTIDIGYNPLGHSGVAALKEHGNISINTRNTT